MFYLSEYQTKSRHLQDHIPWAGLVTSSVVLNKDGSFMRCVRLRGPDLESSGGSALVALHARLNDSLRRFGSGWALFFDSERIPVRDYPLSDFPDPISALIEEERKARFESGDHYENITTLSLLWLPPEDKVEGLWAGPEANQYLGAPPLMICRTSSSTPFRFVHHVGDVGHMMILGPTGAGKSVFLSFMMMQFRRYLGAQIFIFDKGASSRAVILAMGGDFYNLGENEELSFQPLSRIDNEDERVWAQDWLLGLLIEQGLQITPQIREHLWQALNSLSSAPESERTLTGLSLLLQDFDLKEALKPYTLEGPYGRLLDGDQDRLEFSNLQAFEMEALMEKPGAVLPVLTYLFKRLEGRFDGRPTLLILDEAWLFLDRPAFAGKIREWLKVLRKKNVSVIFATQSLADVAGSDIAPVLIESCPSRIFLPNVRAGEPNIREIYNAFGLSARQIELIATSLPKRDYYLQSPLGNRLFDLGLGPLALTFTAASAPEDQKLISQILSSGLPDEFAVQWLKTKGLNWAADLLSNPSQENSHA